MQKIVLITGATSGIGLTMAKTLCNAGYLVYATGRNIPSKSDFHNLHFKYLDVKNNDSVIGAVKGIMEQNNRIDILINCAGLGLAGSLEETPFEEIYNLYETNFFGTIRVIKHVIPIMRQTSGGLIVNISSVAGKVGLPFQGIYSSSKFAIESLTESLSIELKPFGIHVCLIEPGDYNTDANKNRITVIPAKESPYHNRLKGFFELLERNINKGSKPEKINKLILNIVQSESPALRYKSGNFLEKLTPVAKNFIPDRIFEKILCRFYRI